VLGPQPCCELKRAVHESAGPEELSLMLKVLVLSTVPTTIRRLPADGVNPNESVLLVVLPSHWLPLTCVQVAAHAGDVASTKTSARMRRFNMKKFSVFSSQFSVTNSN
jgi:hypothetical protein